ncbi:MAG TPA: Holliday junction resolvase RuvX [Tenericutes bacterium]|nr:Holliday junction resolvase RuvX [Mycoplasmatota bacterium]
MRYLGLDLGTRTLGISLSDITKTIANTYKTIRFNEGDYLFLISQLKKIIEDEEIDKIVLGFPKNMNNTIGQRAEETILFKRMLEDACKIEVILQDERLTTVEANNYMINADMSRKKRKEKIDTLAANIILQTYLDKMKGR